VTPGNADALAEAIAGLASDPARRMRLGEEARASAVRRFSRTRMAEDFLALYDSCWTAGG
jgi:glycosyltransferase involved in cell wall biosynthesis